VKTCQEQGRYPDFNNFPRKVPAQGARAVCKKRVIES
jgi:hypothetical protein